MTEAPSIRTLDRLRAAAQAACRARRPEGQPVVRVGLATCGIAAGALDTAEAFRKAIAEAGIDARVETTGCRGHCYAEPLVVIDHPASGFPPILYPEVTPGKAGMLTRFFLGEGDPRFEHMLGATVANELIPSVLEFGRFNREQRLVMDRCGRLDPQSIDDYLGDGGYGALARVLAGSPQAVVAAVGAAGLRGRGGAGFPTGRKWELAAAGSAPLRYVVCNADEGDPGAYMDRTLIESNPHQLLEGLAICAYAVGAAEAIIYVRAEYPLAVKTLESAIAAAEARGLLGPGVLESGFSLNVTIFQGSGAFVCGEETALLRSVAGFRGTPTHRPPYPAQKGLNGHPTVIDNVKTLATIPVIVERGAEAFRAVGTPDSPGTAIFSVVGDVVHPGLVEIPMGVTLRELIFDICGGVPGKKRFKAVQIGGPSGGCLPANLLDTPVDFDALSEAGAMMGSGGLVVMDEHTCMVDVARYFLEFTRNESCGKCTFCRLGTCHMLAILERICRGQGRMEDLERLERLARDVRDGSLCGLGRTAPNPVLTTLRYFRDEYEAHVVDQRCPGLSCRPLTAFYIDLEKCARGCDACVGCCPVDAVFTTRTRKKGIDQSLCVKCGECMVACPPEYDAVRRISPAHLAPVIERPPAAEAKT
jgi:NADH-quinone oxidoreductase subunit F